MSAKSEAAQMVKALLEDNLQEGTVIIMNGSDGDSQVIDGSRAQAPGKDGPGNGPVRDQFDMERRGKRWHFSIRRDEFGQISDIEVDEQAP